MNFYDDDLGRRLLELETKIQNVQNRQQQEIEKKSSRRWKGFMWFIIVLFTTDFSNRNEW